LTSGALPIIIVEVIHPGSGPWLGGLVVRSKCLILILLSVLVGCASKGKELKSVQSDPERLYQEGLVQYNKRQYEEALKKFEDLKSTFPDSPPYSILAELKVADCHFQKESYPEAIAAYEEFRKTHPTNDEIPYVLYQIGMSYFNQIRTPDRDQNSTRKALTSFEYLIATYPNNFFTERAKEKVAFCLKELADHELYVGQFYYRYEKYEGAAHRFEGLLEQFPKSEDEDTALFFLGKSYIGLGKAEEAKQVLARLVAGYPKSPYVREARTLLDRGIPVKSAPAAKGATPSTSGNAGEAVSLERNQLGVTRFEEEGRKQVPQDGARPTTLPPEKKVAGGVFSDSKPTSFLLSQDASDKQKPISFEATPRGTEGAPKPKGEEMNVVMVPSGEGRQAIRPATGPDLEANPEGEIRKAVAPPVTPPSPVETPLAEEKPGKAEGTGTSEMKVAMIPSGEGRQAIRPSAEPDLEVKPQGEMRKAVAPPGPAEAPVTEEKPGKPEDPQKTAIPEKSSKMAPLEERFKVGDTDQPIDITSDRVETDTKESLITFKGNVTARQRDMVIYADSLEAMISKDGKAIEKVTAGGNVKIQQGLRVANCEKAIYYNLEKKVVLTGQPRVWDGDNMVSGEEIVVDVERNRVEVKGGPAERGKAKITP
jgi:outer membrane protein assembly factor BamD